MVTEGNGAPVSVTTPVELTPASAMVGTGCGCVEGNEFGSISEAEYVLFDVAETPEEESPASEDGLSDTPKGIDPIGAGGSE